MPLITRVSRLFRADLNAVLDRIEEPQMLLRQAVRDMEEDLARDEQRDKLLRHEQIQILSRRRDGEQSLVQIDQELDLCFSSGKDDLARALVRRKLDAEQRHRLLEKRAATLEQDIASLQTRIAEHRQYLDGMRQKAELIAGQQDNGAIEAGWGVTETTVREEDVEIAFLREQQKRRSS